MDTKNKNMKRKFLIFLLAAILIGSCGRWMLDMTQIRPGMTKEQVYAVFKGKKPDGIVGSKQYPYGIVDVYGYYTKEYYWFYFLNDTLIQYGRPGDWQKEADIIIEKRIK